MSGYLDRTNELLNAVSRMLYGVAIAVMLVMAFHIFLSVSSRLVLGREIAGTLEFTTYYYMPALMFLALPLIDEMGGHIRADLVAWLGPRPARYLEAVTRVALAVFFGWLAWYGFTNALDKTMEQEVTRSAGALLPVWPGRWVIPVAGLLAAAHSIVAAGRALWGADLFHHPAGPADDAVRG